MQQSDGGAALPALTSIRFLAAVCVALSHYTELGLLNLSPSFIRFVDGGRPAVSFFFVLSGFILTYTYAGALGNGGVRRFYVARFARIYPTALLSLLIASGVTVYLLRGNHNDLLLDWYALKSNIGLPLAASFVCQVLVLIAWFPFATINQPWNSPAWSISCEAFFYALFPMLIKRLTGKKLRTIGWICVSAWILQGIWIFVVRRYVPSNRGGFIISQFPVTHLFEFVLGISTAIAFNVIRQAVVDRHRIGIFFICGALLGIGLLAGIQPIRPAYFLESPFFAILILGIAIIERPVVSILNRHWVILLGEASFSLYLIHVPLAHVATILGFDRTNGWIALLVVIGASIVVFKFFEEPSRKAIRYRLSGSAPYLRPSNHRHRIDDLSQNSSK